MKTSPEARIELKGLTVAVMLKAIQKINVIDEEIKIDTGNTEIGMVDISC